MYRHVGFFSFNITNFLTLALKKIVNVDRPLVQNLIMVGLFRYKRMAETVQYNMSISWHENTFTWLQVGASYPISYSVAEWGHMAA